MKTSVVVPTYTGLGHLSDCLASIFRQSSKPDEIIIVIDGPGQTIRKTVDTAIGAAGPPDGFKVIVHQNKKNLGRFKARQKGAKLAGGEQLLFVDDRTELKRDYLAVVERTKERVVIPDVKEKAGKGNLIELVNSALRHKLFDKYSGSAYAITPLTFDELPKGTSGLWVPRQWFLDACEAVARQEKVDAHTSDDTKLLRVLVNAHGRIYHESKAVAHYSPREKLSDSISHIFRRGPKFVDYYLQPGRRYFLPLIFFYTALALAILLLVVYPFFIIVLLGVSAAAGLWLAKGAGDFFKFWLGLWLVGVAFGAGLVWGFLKKI